jgi:hypothetical protein
LRRLRLAGRGRLAAARAALQQDAVLRSSPHPSVSCCCLRSMLSPFKVSCGFARFFFIKPRIKHHWLDRTPPCMLVNAQRVVP